jgi:hypothetical protein
MLNDNKPKELLTVQGSVPQSYYDDRYVEAYIANPGAGKCAALRLAGYQGEYVTQEASRLRKRLAGRIRELSESRAVEGISVGLDIMLQLAKDADTSDSVRGAMAKSLIEYGERIQATSGAESPMSIQDIETELALLETSPT